LTTQGSGGSPTARPAGENELVARIVSGVTLAVIALVGAVLGGWATAIVLGIVTAMFHLEWVNLTDRRPFPGAVFTGALVIAIAMATQGFVGAALIICGLAIIFSGLTGSMWRPVGVAYAAVLGVGLVILRLTPEGLAGVLIVLAVVTATDTGAFFAGRAIGGPKLAPSISPNKTRAGAIGGLISGVVVSLVVAVLVRVPITVPLVLIVALLSISGQAGDLFESWVKRVFGAKDSGRIIPGHGGLMDRVDGLAIASGVAVLIGWLHDGGNVAAGLLQW
jgi:phosphatidate cytidylyltransferase